MLGLRRKLTNWHMTSIYRGYSNEASTFKGPILRRAQVPELEYEDEEALEQATEMEAKQQQQQQQLQQQQLQEHDETGTGAKLATDKVQVAIKLPLYTEANYMRPVTAVEGVRLEGNAKKENLNGEYHMYSLYDLNEMAMQFRNETGKKE